VPVEIPLDKICVRTGVFCPRCQRLLDEGVYDELDVKVMRALLSIERELGSYNIRFVKAQRLDHKVVVTVEAPGGALPAGLGRRIQEAMDDPTVSDVIVLPHGGGLQRLLEYAVRPFRIVDTVINYAPDGREYLIVKLPRQAKDQLDPGLVRVVVEIAKKKYGKSIIFEYVDVSEEEPSEKISIQELRRILGNIDRL